MKHIDFKQKLRAILAVMMIFAGVTVFAQQISVTGVVRDAVTGEPIFGVNILEKGTTNGTITDFDGNFTLQVPSRATLIFKYVGYQSIELPVNGQTKMTVQLKEDAIAIGEVLVIGYGTVKKNDATGSVAAIKPDAMNKGLTTNAQEMLAGKIAGVNVVSGGGTPGSGATIRIRGGSSLSASNDPLIVIDGLAMDNEGIKGVANQLSTINPNDIESFTVLKDASATAIYGSRASNGVIIITTKKGDKNQKPRISYEGNGSVSVLGKRYDVLSANEFRTLVNDRFAAQPEVLAKLGAENTDWQDQIFQNAYSQDHNVSVMGGVKNVPYRASLGYTNQNGILKTSKFERFTGSVSASPSFLDDHLKINLNAKGMFINNRYAETGAVGAAVSMDPTQPVMSNDEPYASSFGGYTQFYNVISDKVWFNTLSTRNPLATLMQKEDLASSRNFIGSADVDYKFHALPELRVHLNMGTDQAYGKQTLYIPIEAASDHNWGREGFEEISKFNNSLNMWAQYAKEVDLHSFDVMGGYEWQHFYREGNNSYQGLVRSDSNGDGSVTDADNFYNPTSKLWKTESKLVSFFGRANYSFANRYLFTATVRLDGSSRFAPENRWGTFPSFAFAWKLNEEEFMSEVDAVSDLKVRLGYGVTGQQNIGQGDYPYIPVYKENIVGAYYPFENADGVLEYYPTYRPNAYNANLKWEETTTINAGLDFGFFKSRLTGTLDYYFRESRNLLNVVDIPMGTNFSNRVITNIGNMEIEGVELSLNGKIISKKDISWEVGMTASKNQDIITKLIAGSGEGFYVGVGGISSGVGANIQAHSVGHPAYSFYVYQQIYDENGAPVEGKFENLYTADDKVNTDGTRTPVINSNDKYFYKSRTPDFIFGLNSKLVYKKFDIGFSLRGSIGNYMYNDAAARSHNMSNSGIYSSSGNGFLSNKPASALVTNFNKNAPDSHMSDYYVQDASFARIDNITAGYSFDKVLDVFSGGRIYASVQNPLIITNYSGLDPEIFDGIDRDLYPRPVVTMIGLSLKF